MTTERPRVIIIGLDGGTFDLLNPLMSEGIMPALTRIRDASAWGTLHSTQPPTTPPAWTTCTTGLNPGRHGIFDFTVSPLEDPERPLVNARTARGCRLWEWLDSLDQRSIFINVPITYPPVPFNGCMISGMMTPGFDAPFTHPPELRDRLKAYCGNYIPNVDIPQYDTAGEKDARRFIEDVAECMERRREAVRYLMDTESWTVFMAVFVSMDRVLHLFAKYLFPETRLYDTPRAHRLRPLLIDLMRRLDDIIDEMAHRAQSRDTLIIMSDHGFGCTEGFFNANTWLKHLGLLAVKPIPYTRARLFHAAQQFSEQQWLKTLVPESVQSAVRRRIRKTRSTLQSARSDLEKTIDWPGTQAFFGSIPTQGIYINEKTPENTRGTVPPDAVNALRNRIRNALLKLTHPDTGERITDAVYDREELFHGDRTQYAPHLLFRMRNHAILGRQHPGPAGYYSSAEHLPVGFHRDNGMIIIRHPAIPPSHIEASMTDVMPTVLYAVALPVPDNLDGKVLDTIFSETYRASHAVTYRPPIISKPAETAAQTEAEYGEAERIALENRLKKLGYLE